MNGSIGAHRVREDFNPSGDELVTKIKRYTADLIDLCETLKHLDMRCASIAQTEYEAAAMWAVKAATTKGAHAAMAKEEIAKRVHSTMAAQGTMADLKPGNEPNPVTGSRQSQSRQYPDKQ